MVASFSALTPWNMEGYILLQDRNLMNYSEMCLETPTEIALKKKFYSNNSNKIIKTWSGRFL